MKLLLCVMLIIPGILQALPTEDLSADFPEKAVNSIEDIAASIISDSFNPMTHYSEGDTILYMVPGWFTADRLMKDPDIKSRNFTGLAMGAGAGHALTDRLMAYLIFAGMKIDADIIMPVYGEEFETLKSGLDYSLATVLAGGGYDLYENDYISIPVYMGINLQYYSAEITPDSFEYSNFSTYTVKGLISGSGLLYGISGGIALSAKLSDFFRITPYFLYIRNLNSAKMDAEVTAADNASILPSAGWEDSFSMKPVSAGMAGLNLRLETKTGFSFSVSAGSTISSLLGFGNPAASNDVKMKSVFFILSYRY